MEGKDDGESSGIEEDDVIDDSIVSFTGLLTLLVPDFKSSLESATSTTKTCC